jgi:ATP-dependent Clp protease ATP-binding subunit ClpC
MFERFTNRARRVVVLAQEEARLLNHNYIGTEHILLGLIHDGEGAAAKALHSLGLSLEAVRHQVEEIIGKGQQAPSGNIPFTPRGKKVLELSSREAKKLGHKHIGTGHLLLGLIRERRGVAAQALVQLGAELPTVKQQVIQQLVTYGDHEGTSTIEQDLVDEELELPDEELTEHAAFLRGDQAEEIRTLLSDIVERLKRIERQLTEDDDTP